MSPATEKLLSELAPFFIENGFKLQKSKHTFIKTKDGFDYKIHFKFDGRGGLTMVDWIDVSVISVEIEKLCAKTTGFSFPIYYQKINFYEGDVYNNKIQIPMMYSKKALDIANDMNLRKLGQLTFDEKYPPERIINCARSIEKLLIDYTIFENFDKEYSLYNEYEKHDDFLQNPKLENINGYNILYNKYENDDNYHLNEARFLYFLILMHKLKIPHSELVKRKFELLSIENKQAIEEFYKRTS